MISTIAVIAKKKNLKKRFSDRSDHSDHMETTLQRSQRGLQRQRSLRYRKSSISAIVVAAIAELVFLSDRSNRSDHIETRLYCDNSMKRFAAS